LMRSVTGTVPAMFGPSAFAGGGVLCPATACADAHVAMTAAAAVSAVVRRNARRVGVDGLEDGSSRIRASRRGPRPHLILFGQESSVSATSSPPSAGLSHPA